MCACIFLYVECVCCHYERQRHIENDGAVVIILIVCLCQAEILLLRRECERLCNAMILLANWIRDSGDSPKCTGKVCLNRIVLHCYLRKFVET